MLKQLDTNAICCSVALKMEPIDLKAVLKAILFCFRFGFFARIWKNIHLKRNENDTIITHKAQRLLDFKLNLNDVAITKFSSI